jgi:drug/metabolite transporter (DMT)-like permease
MSITANKPARPSNREGTAYLLGVLGVTIFGGTLPAMRLAVAALGPVFVTAGRAAVAGTLAALILSVLRPPLPSRKDRYALMAGTICLVGAFPFFSRLALRTAEASHGAVVLAILPLMTAVAATLVARERLSLAFCFWSAMGGVAVLAFVLLEAKGRWTAADGLFFIAGLCSAFGYALSGALSRRMRGWEVICWQLVAALPVTLIVSVLFWPPAPLSSVPVPALLAFAYVSLFSMFLSFFAWNAAMALGGVAKVGQLQLLQVFVTLAVSSLILGEKLDAATMGFALLVVAIVALGQRAKTEIRE